ncbi:hypothetical protein BH23GEM9_BH23GEM9_35160 [soil metagenome]
MRVLSIALLLTTMATACRIEPNPTPEILNVDSVARAQLRATMEAYRDARLRNDADAIASFYAAESRLSQPGEADLVGGAQVQDAMRDFHARGGAITHLVVDRDDLHVRDSLAFELGTFEERTRMGGEERDVHGRYMIRWRRGPDSRWVIDRFLLNHMPPDTATERDP